MVGRRVRASVSGCANHAAATSESEPASRPGWPGASMCTDAGGGGGGGGPGEVASAPSQESAPGGVEEESPHLGHQLKRAAEATASFQADETVLWGTEKRPEPWEPPGGPMRRRRQTG